MMKSKTRRGIQLKNLSLDEIAPFYRSLDENTRTRVDPPLPEDIEFATGVRVKDRLAAIGGLKRSRFGLRFTFHIVKAEYEKLGLGHDITRDIVEYARGRGYSHFLGTLRLSNAARLPYFMKEGYRLVSVESDLYVRSVFPLNRKGEILVDVYRILFNIVLPIRSMMRTVRAGRG
ncbi:MAG: hypothetical protein AB1640_21120 [bacterium]